MKASSPLRYQEEVPAPLWLQAVILFGVAALVAGVAVSAATGQVGWQTYALYYPFMALVGALLVFVFFSFRYLRIAVSDEELRFAFGMLRRTLPLAAIQSVEAKKYRWLTYGGWGIRYALGGRRAWSLPGVPEGVEFTLAEGTRVRRYFVSSRSPELLAEAVRGR
ncbi:MAG: DUF3093 family protein [Dehalococcoidia bacterium]|nr:DUF3093 family protein [Dehalococcoidia bacterium]